MSKKIANFTQTYSTSVWSPGSDGKNREFLIDALVYNKEKHKIINLMNLPSFNFHNVEKEIHEKYQAKIKKVVPDCNFFYYNNMTLGSSILIHLKKLKNMGITDFLWVQDDEFFIHNNFKDFKNLLDFYKENSDIKHINLLYKIEDWSLVDYHHNYKNVCMSEIISISNDLKVFKTTTNNLKNTGGYCMDFTSFICNIDYFLEYMFSEKFVNYYDAYQLEGAVNDMSRKNNVQRYFTNINFFESFNIVGMPPSLGSKDISLSRLRNLVRK